MAALEVLRIGGLRGFKGWWFAGLCCFSVMRFASFVIALHYFIDSSVFEVLMAFVLKSTDKKVWPSNAANTSRP